MAWMAAAGMAAQAVTGIVGGIMANKAIGKGAAQQKAMMLAGLHELNKIGMPPDLSARVLQEEFKRQGVYEPDIEEDIQMAASQVAIIQEDPSLRDAQLGALTSMQDVARTGFDTATEADIRAARGDIGEDVQGKLGQIQQQMAARGQGGSGTELAMQLQAAQEGDRRASEESDRMAAMASQNALNAIAQSGEMAGNMRSQDFNVDATRAGAADQFSLADWAQQNARQTANVGTLNDAQRINLGEAQRIADANVGMENTERQRMNQAKQDQWDRKLQQAEAKANVWSGMGTNALEAGLGKGRAISGAAGGVSKAAGGAAGAMSGKGK